MKRVPVKLLVTAGTAVVGGIFTLSLVSSFAVKAVQATIQAKRKREAPPCGVCKGQGFIPCKLCKGQSAIKWSPLYSPIFPKPCVCPTCEGNKIQKCLNCIGRGFV